MHKLGLTIFICFISTVNAMGQEKPIEDSPKNRLLSFYYSTGINNTNARVNEPSIETEEEYASNNGFQMNLGVSFPLMKKIALNVGISYANNSYSLSNQIIPDQNITYNLNEDLRFISIPVRLKLSPFESRLRPFLEIGGSYSRLLKSEISGERSGTSILTINTTDAQLRNRNLFFISIGIGLEYKLGRGNVFVNGFYNHSKTELIKTEDRLENQNGLFSSGYVETNRSLNSLQFNIGYSFTIFRKG